VDTLVKARCCHVWIIRRLTVAVSVIFAAQLSMAVRERRTRGKWIGRLAFIILALNALATLAVFFLVDDAVDSGLGVAFFVLYITLPLAAVSLILGLVGIFRQSGLVPAAITVGLIAAGLTFGLYGFASTQLF
jgi:hypothetical protein